MGAETRIEWADHTFNPWTGCQAVSPACDHCYAEAQAKRNTSTFGGWGPHAERKRTSESYWRQPLKWNSEARRAGTRPRVFCASMADIMDKAAPLAWFIDALDLMRITQHLIWLLLTKRPQLIRRRLEEALAHLAKGTDRGDLIEWIALWLDGHPPENVWLGATAENREEMLRRAARLNDVPAIRRFWSVEPLLGDLGEIPTTIMPHWVIAGGESGPKARPSHPDWFRSLRDQCQAAGVPFFFKQWGEYSYHPIDPKSSAEHLCCIDDQGRNCALSRSTEQDAPWWFLPAGGSIWQERRDIPAGVIECRRVGKKAAGALLDGREWREVPA